MWLPVSLASLPSLQLLHAGLGVPAVFLQYSVLSHLLISVSSKKASTFCLILCIHPYPGHSKSNEWMGHKGTHSRSCPPHSFFQTAAGGPPLKVTPTYSLLCHLSPFSAPSPGSLRLYLETSMQSPLPPGNLPWKFLQLSAGLPSVTGRPTDSPGIRSSLPSRPWPL